MSFIRSFTINTERQHPFPFNIPAVRYARAISLDQAVTVFVGDNGCGKSTLLESLALVLDVPLTGGYIGSHPGFEAARAIQPYLEIDWRRQTKKGYFFRAEDFSDFVNSVEREQNKIRQDLADLQGKVDEAIIRQMSDSMNFSLREMRRKYGDNMQAFSHGEAYLTILQTRIGEKGVYLLDEPEAALSPLKQLSLIGFMLEAIKDKNVQFILSTHSPILMGFPEAVIYEIQEEGMKSVAYKETDHYRITKTFLDNPDYYLRHLR